jgi:hypothetical protein
MVYCVELLIDAVDAPATPVAWKENCQPVTQTNIAVGKRVAIWDVHPPEDLRESCNHDIFSKRTNHLTYRCVWSHFCFAW